MDAFQLLGEHGPRIVESLLRDQFAEGILGDRVPYWSVFSEMDNFNGKFLIAVKLGDVKYTVFVELGMRQLVERQRDSSGSIDCWIPMMHDAAESLGKAIREKYEELGVVTRIRAVDLPKSPNSVDDEGVRTIRFAKKITVRKERKKKAGADMGGSVVLDSLSELAGRAAKGRLVW